MIELTAEDIGVYQRPYCLDLPECQCFPESKDEPV